MKNKLIYKLTWLALAVSIISLALFIGVEETDGDTSMAVWFILLLLLTFVSAPLHVIVLIGAIALLVKRDGNVYKWVFLYLIVAISGHLVIAANKGAFDDVLRDAAQIKRAIDEPAQVKLEQAMRRGPSSNIKEVRSALANGADANAGISDNRIPFLVLAALRSDTPVIKALLDAGADPNRRASFTEYGVSFYVSVKNPLPLDVAVFSENNSMLESVKLLLAAGADPSQSIIKLGACRQGNMHLYDMAKELGASGLLDANNQTCLHHATATGQVELIETLLFDPSYEAENVKESLTMNNRFGQYPLDVAITAEQFGAAQLIVKAGGIANKKWTIERALGNQANDPSMYELKKLLLRDQKSGS